MKMSQRKIGLYAKSIFELPFCWIIYRQTKIQWQLFIDLLIVSYFTKFQSLLNLIRNRYWRTCVNTKHRAMNFKYELPFTNLHRKKIDFFSLHSFDFPLTSSSTSSSVPEWMKFSPTTTRARQKVVFVYNFTVFYDCQRYFQVSLFGSKATRKER